MKKLILSALIVLATAPVAFSQVQLTLYTGYQFGSSTNYYGYQSGRFKVNGSQDWAAMLSVAARPGTQIEFSYTYMSTSAQFERAGIIDESVGDVDIHYYQIGGVQESNVSENVDLFGTVAFGGTTFAPKDSRYQNNTFFSIGLGGGLKLWISDAIGIRAQARLLMPVTWGGLTFGTGGAGITTGSSIISGDIGGGLIFRFGN
ncbi:MAG: hypothetical protein N4A46_12590 [Schleiferiaceae bacterium]|jgi:hypothetical protein|nr:hypothetical protein [Schleiferiaceae bacterium]